MTLHQCNAIVVTCIDFRFQKYLRDWLEKNLKDKTYDFVGFAGSTKELETIIKQIDISKRLHHVNQVILIHHEDCGAYGKEGTYKRHSKDLKKAEKQILLLYPDLQVALYYLYLNGKFKKIT